MRQQTKKSISENFRNSPPIFELDFALVSEPIQLRKLATGWLGNSKMIWRVEQVDHREDALPPPTTEEKSWDS